MTSNPTSRPSYPQQASDASSVSSSAFQSSSSLPSLAVPSSNPASRQQVQPLPSPTNATAQQHFGFGSIHPSSAPQQERRGSAFDYRPERANGGKTAAETGQFLSNYNLVAEAAKRAQMAVLARDLDAMEM